MRKILITNDDGIEAEGLVRLAGAAQGFGEVYVIAPDSQRSAASHSIVLRKGVKVWEKEFPVPGVKAYACDGQPADCVRIGVLNIVPGGPDCVFSGINYGYNVAADLQYSATVGAAMEGSFQGVRSIAFSEGAIELHRVTDRYLREVMGALIDKPAGPWQIWNVNFPGCELDRCRGIMWDTKPSHKGFYRDRYSEKRLDEGTMEYMVDGIPSFEAEEGTDLWAMHNHFVSVGLVKNIGWDI
jgi:5'-nucleotidase